MRHVRTLVQVKHTRVDLQGGVSNRLRPCPSQRRAGGWGVRTSSSIVTNRWTPHPRWTPAGVRP